jgi:hypothetical protein
MKRNKKKLITISLLLLIIPLSLFATYEQYTYFSYSYTLNSSYDLEEIYIENAHTSEYSTNGEAAANFYGYYMGQIVIDFNDGSNNGNRHRDKQLISDNHAAYDTNYKGTGYNSYIYDTDGNKSNITIYTKVTKKSSSGSIKTQKWYELSDIWYNTYDTDIIDESYTIDYYFTINDFEVLNYNQDLTIHLPVFTTSDKIPYYYTKVEWNNQRTIIDPILTTYTNISVGQIDASSFIDAYTLDVSFSKLYNDSNTDFFDGDKHDYYSLTINSYLDNVAVDKDFDVALQVSSDHNFQLYLDNDDDASSDEKIPYDLYLKYMGSSTGAYNYASISNNEIFLIANINTYSAAKTLYITTQSDDAIATYNTKGTYQDTIYLNFITEGWQNSSSFYDTLIDLN